MSLLRQLLDKIAPLDDAALPRPEQFASVEEYAFALTCAGVETDQARELIRAAVRRHAQEQATRREVGYRDREGEAREKARESAAGAARQLLREVGWHDEYAEPLPAPELPRQRVWALSPTQQEATLDHDPLFDGVDGDGRPLRRRPT